MTNELSRLIEDYDRTIWANKINHQRCFCHVLALILGAGLAAIKLSSSKGPISQKPDQIPMLPTITKEGDLIVDEDQLLPKFEPEIDPNNVSEASSESDSEGDDDDHEVSEKSKAKLKSKSEKSKGKYAETGIGFTLKKVSEKLVTHQIFMLIADITT